MLHKRNLIDVVGRKDTIGKPLLYGTTDEFLKRFQISSLDELPDYDEVLDRIKVLNLVDTSKDLYNLQKDNEGGDTGDKTADADINNSGG